jgi:uncharacterized protein YjiS (DUF1127 family)
MVPDYIWQNANPELRGPLRAANEARAATYYAAWRALTAPLRALQQALGQTLGQARREGENFRALNRLSDRQLHDIGISRSEIGIVAKAIAAKPLEAGMTIAELRQTESIASAGGGVTATPRPHVAQHRRAPARQAAPADRHREAA